jgi:hypothetical protein
MRRHCVRENACHETPKKLEVVAGLDDKGRTAKVVATLGRETVAMVRMIGCMEIASFAFPGQQEMFL